MFTLHRTIVLTHCRAEHTISIDRAAAISWSAVSISPLRIVSNQFGWSDTRFETPIPNNNINININIDTDTMAAPRRSGVATSSHISGYLDVSEMDKYKLMSNIGKGSFGVISKVQRVDDGRVSCGTRAWLMAGIRSQADRLLEDDRKGPKTDRCGSVSFARRSLANL